MPYVLSLGQLNMAADFMRERERKRGRHRDRQRERESMAEKVSKLEVTISL